MVFQDIVHCPRDLLCGAFCIAVDLVAAEYATSLENRTVDQHPCTQLVLVPSNPDVDQHLETVLRSDDGVLKWLAVKGKDLMVVRRVEYE